MIDLTEILKELRQKTKLSMEEVALASGYSKQTIFNVEKGKRGASVYSLMDILEVYGYELKVVKKGIFSSDIIEWTKELPEAMHPDQEADEMMIEEFGRPIVTDDDYLVISDENRMYSSRLYLFDDGKIEMEGYFDEKPVEWMLCPRKED